MSRFKEIEGYNNDYFITEDGDVISVKRGKKILLKKRVNSRGYYYVNLCKNGKYKSICIHRLVGIYFVENNNGFNVLNHIDGNKLNNRYDNLEWCDQVHNMKETSRMGLLKIKRGAESNLYSGKLNIDISNMIRSIRSNEKLSYDKIAKMFDVSKATIINICKNRIYT